MLYHYLTRKLHVPQFSLTLQVTTKTPDSAHLLADDSFRLARSFRSDQRDLEKRVIYVTNPNK